MAEEPVEVVRKLNDACYEGTGTLTGARVAMERQSSVYVIRDGKAISAKFRAAE